MIKITALTGPFAGQIREASSDISPERLLQAFVRQGWDWQIDYSRATEQEKWTWARQDLTGRCFRALLKGLSVYFLGREFGGIKQAEVLEDAIVNSRRMVTIGRDDETGVEITTHGWEH